MKRTSSSRRTKSSALVVLSLILSPSTREATLSSSAPRMLQQRRPSIATKKQSSERSPTGPTLDKARQVIPGILDRIYKALDQGNPQSVRSLLSVDVANNSEKLDAICQPFTYRAHYVESIIERPHQWFEARVRVLFKPIDEHAYVLLFSVSQGRFFLNDILDPPNNWFASQEAAAIEIARKFIYAVKAARLDVIRQLVTADLDTSLISTADYKSEFDQISGVEVKDVSMKAYKGLKAEVRGITTQPIICYSNWTFLVDRVEGEYKIVKWHYEPVVGCFPLFGPRFEAAPEDPYLEENTLKRFGLAKDNVTSKVSSASDLGTSGPAKESTPESTSEPSRLTSSALQDAREMEQKEASRRNAEEFAKISVAGTTWQGRSVGRDKKYFFSFDRNGTFHMTLVYWGIQSAAEGSWTQNGAEVHISFANTKDGEMAATINGQQMNGEWHVPEKDKTHTYRFIMQRVR